MELVLQLVCSVKKKTVDSRILVPYLPGHVGCQGIENSLSAFPFLFFFPSSFFFFLNNNNNGQKTSSSF
jgi:hypothetical protein